MALFFDSAWFDRRLAENGLSRADAARALGLGEAQVDELWKDQREVLPAYVQRLALLLGASEDEVRKRAGVQGPPMALRGQAGAGPAAAPAAESRLAVRLDDIEARLARIEAALAHLTRSGE